MCRTLSLFMKSLSLTQTRTQTRRNHVAVATDSLTFAVGGTDGTIHVYDWESRRKTTERTVVDYRRSYLEPRPITFSFMFGSRFILVGGEEEVATVIHVDSAQHMASLYHQSESGFGIFQPFLRFP